MGEIDLILEFHCYYTSVIHRFRSSQVLLVAGNDVIVVYGSTRYLMK